MSAGDNFKNCLFKFSSAGKWSKDTATEAAARYDELVLQFKNQGEFATQAQLRAKEQLLREKAIASFVKRKQDRIMILKQKEYLIHEAAYINIKGQQDPVAAAQAIYVQDPEFGIGRRAANGTGRIPLESHIKEVQGIVEAGIVEISEMLKPGWFALDTKISKTTRANLNEALGKEISEIADEPTRLLVQTFRNTMDWLVVQFNKAGGHIEKITGIYIPQAHDVGRLVSTGAVKWIDDILPRLDLSKMIDRFTGMAFSPEAARLALHDVYESIVTRGFSKGRSGEFAATNIGNSRLDHRFLIFKKGEQVKYNALYGPENTDIVGLIQDYINSMSRDIAFMKSHGSNPHTFHKWVKARTEQQGAALDRLQKEGNFTRREISFGTEMDRTISGLQTFDNLFAHFNGTLLQPGHSFIARSMATLRQVLTASHLGAATIPAVTDLNWQRLTNGFNGLPATKSMRRAVQMSYGNIVGNDQIQKVAIRLGLGSEYWSAKLHEMTRYFVEQGGFLWSRKLADGILRGTGLSGVTAAGRWGFGMEFMAAMAQYSKLSSKEIPKNFFSQMRKYGISAEDWEIAKQAKFYDAAIDDNTIQSGVMVYLRPDDIRLIKGIPEGYADKLAGKFMNWINTETNYAIPSFTAKGRIALTGGAKGGTPAGELLLSFSMFKQFPMTIIFTHLQRMLQRDSGIGKLGYLSDLFISTTILGAMTLEAKQKLNGERGTPLDEMAKGRYWQRAALQGGGLGLFGDFTLAEHNRYGRGFGQTLAGPVVSFLADVLGMTTDQIQKFSNGEETTFAKSVIRFIENNAPGHSIWYAKLVWKRIIIDAMKRMTDDNYDSSMQKMINSTYRNKGTTYWWKPGDRLPSFD